MVMDKLSQATQRTGGSAAGSDTASSDGGRQASSAPPTLSLPKGGGAIRGIGEKFAPNPVTGTGSMTVPIATSPGRGGFGFGWSLSVPAITRNSDKGLPQYRDAEEPDVFILSGAEDLAPVLAKASNGQRVSQV